MSLSELLASLPTPFHREPSGALFSLPCEELFALLPDACFDVVFLDPPFNLGKDYGPGPEADALAAEEYTRKLQGWVREAARVLRPGGAFWSYHLPVTSVGIAGELPLTGLTLRNWIAVSQHNRPSIRGRLYPEHYALLYATKGAARTFNRVYVPFQKCRHCKGMVKDYGGHLGDFKVEGTSLSDIWNDVPGVYHRSRKGGRRENTLNPKLLARVLRVSSEPGDLVLDPFAGYGTTAMVARQLGRSWLCTERTDFPVIGERLAGPPVNLGADL